MTAAQVLQMQFDRLTQEFKNTLGNLGAQRLAWRPAPRANDIASVLWHSARAWDGYLVFLDGKADTFETEDWTNRFGMSRKSKDPFNDGYNESRVVRVRARPKVLCEYVDALLGRTKNLLDAASGEQLAAPIKIPWWPEVKPQAFVLAHIIRHSYQHLGEAQYVKGMMKAKVKKPRAKHGKTQT